MKAIISAHGNGKEPNTLHIGLCQDFGVGGNDKRVGLQLKGPGSSVICTIGPGAGSWSTNITPGEISTYYFTRWIWVMEI